MKTTFLFSTMFLMIILTTSSLFAIPYTVGGITVDVEVRSKTMIQIVDAKVKVFLKNNTFVVQVEAKGYEDQTVNIPYIPNQKTYKCDVVLEDMNKEVVVMTSNWEELSSAYVDKHQYGYDPSFYGIKAHLPKKVWPKPATDSVSVIDIGWGLQIQDSVSIDEVDEFWRIQILIPRKALKFTTPRLMVILDLSPKKPVTDGEVQNILGSLAKAEKNSSKEGYIEGMAKFIMKSIPTDQIEKSMKNLPNPPGTVSKYLSEAKKFGTAHEE
ncbi:MAG: hypothetical protein HQM08_06225 [Candidatus Riflebacteria bacterium]|nr:hypothetical protein [Candidatus Riflebacteria bacterium]